MYSKIELNSIACAKISTKTSNTRLCAYRCVQGWRKHFKLGGDIHKKHIFNIYKYVVVLCFWRAFENIASFGVFREDLALFSAKFDGGDATPTVPTLPPPLGVCCKLCAVV